MFLSGCLLDWAQPVVTPTAPILPKVNQRCCFVLLCTSLAICVMYALNFSVEAFGIDFSWLVPWSLQEDVSLASLNNSFWHTKALFATNTFPAHFPVTKQQETSDNECWHFLPRGPLALSCATKYCFFYTHIWHILMRAESDKKNSCLHGLIKS